MKLLFINKLARFARSTYTISKYVEAGRHLGHEIAVFGEESPEVASVPYSLDVRSFDFAVFVVHIAADFPDLPYLARLLDQMPRERRVIIDCQARYNDTVRVEHDFNHLEKLDGHQGWEWVEGFQALSDVILQPTMTPLRSDVRPFWFYGFDPAAVARAYDSPRQAAAAWADANGSQKRYGMAYVGNNWQRWTQMRSFLEALAPVREQIGAMLLAGWDWRQRPEWDVQLGLHGADVDPGLLAQLGVETRDAVSFDEVTQLLSSARFSPVFHRPLFQHLGLITNRTFETFCADTIPALMLPEETVEAVYGPEARLLLPGQDVAAWVSDVWRDPERYWAAVLQSRARLAQNHSYAQRLRELTAILEGRQEPAYAAQSAG